VETTTKLQDLAVSLTEHLAQQPGVTDVEVVELPDDDDDDIIQIAYKLDGTEAYLEIAYVAGLAAV
jgi:hypothetical protein